MYDTMTKKQFWQAEVPLNVKKKINNCAGAAYISGVLTLAVGILLEAPTVIDALLSIGLGIGVQMGKSRVCSIALTVIFGISKLVQMASGFASVGILGIVFLILFVNGISGTFQYHKLWQEHKNKAQAQFVPPTIQYGSEDGGMGESPYGGPGQDSNQPQAPYGGETRYTTDENPVLPPIHPMDE